MNHNCYRKCHAKGLSPVGSAISIVIRARSQDQADSELQCSIRQTSLVLHSPDSTPLERYIFSTDLFPMVRKSEIMVPFESSQASAQHGNPMGESKPTTTSAHHAPSMLELTAQFAAVLSRISTQTTKLSPLPQNCSFTLAIELRSNAGGQLPQDNHPKWLPSEPGLQPVRNSEKGKQIELDPEHTFDEDTTEPRRHRRGKYLGGARTTAIRTVDAAPFIMEVWLEESKQKVSPTDAK